MPIINSISIKGYKSIRNLPEFPLTNINVLIGANGAGKTNLISFFRLLRELIDQRLQLAVAREGGMDRILYLGLKETQNLSASLRFGSNGYDFNIGATADDRAVFIDEQTFYDGTYGWTGRTIASGVFEASLKNRKDDAGVQTKHGVPYYVYNAVSDWTVYHFHDTSDSAPVRRPGPINLNQRLLPDAANLAAYLYFLRESKSEAYSKIVNVVRLVCPFFSDFVLRPMALNEEVIRLEWKQVGTDYPLLASQMSDGTIRFICLATALLQHNLPQTVLYDEPELGLHPYALTVLASLFRQSTLQFGGVQLRQVIISTQSSALVDLFKPEDVIVVEKVGDESTFRRVDALELSDWLESYSLGQLWDKNLLGGRPRSPDFLKVSTQGNIA